MDVTPYLQVRPAPIVFFDALPERQSRVRFMVPKKGPDGALLDWEAVTWGAQGRAIREMALFLAGEGLRPGDRATIFAPNRVEWMAAALAIEAAGGVMVPIYPASTAPQAAYVANHSEAKFLFVDTAPLLERVLEIWPSLERVERVVLFEDLDVERALERLRQQGKATPSFAEFDSRSTTWARARALGAAKDREDATVFERLLDALSLDQQAIMLYTSGTTGNPKGVPLTHANQGLNTRDWMQVLAPLLPENGVDLFWLPMSHIFGYGESTIGDILGFTTYLASPQDVLQRMPEVRPSVFMSVPSYWEKLANSALSSNDPAEKRRRLMEATGGNLKFCLSGGAGLKREVKDTFHQSGLLIIEGYGLTETAPTLTMNRPDNFRFDSVGKPFPSVQLTLAEDGEILAKGPNVFGGYYKDAAATQQAFTPDGWFKTGDVGRWTNDGFLQIIDRKKDILVTAGGKNVPPANIELAFRDDPFIAHVVVYGDGKKFLVAGVWLHEDAVKAHFAQQGATASPELIRSLVQQRIERVNAELASYESIKKFEIFSQPLTVESGLLTATLKVRRKKVYEAFGAALEALYQ